MNRRWERASRMISSRPRSHRHQRTPLVTPERIHTIPEELRSRPRWVLWRLEERGGRGTKVPYMPTGTRAKSDDPRTWSPFEMALDCLTRNPTSYTGLGYVFAKQDGLIGVDLDHCLDPSTSTPLPWARHILDLLDSYTEISPSGTGLHVILKGTKPDQRCKQTRVSGAPPDSGFEWYDSHRYFTVSGDIFPGATSDIAIRNGELKQVRDLIWPPNTPPTTSRGNANPDDDQALLDRIRASAQGQRFDILWRGDWRAAGYPSQSEADLALCAILAFWTRRDAQAMDRLFRKSRLFRHEKWDRPAGQGRTYGERTIEMAIAGCTDIFGEHKPLATVKESCSPIPAPSPSDVQARELFPRRAFPWHVLPAPIAESLKQLARSCAGSPNPLPGTLFCLMGAALGRSVAVSPKSSWREPLIFWHLDIEESGSGKTSPMWMLAEVMKRRQVEEHERHAREFAAWRSQPRDDAPSAPEPSPARGYFLTDATLEGLRYELEGHPTGGLAMLLNEASFLLNSHNQYKTRGTDREAWLCLWDGHPVRVVRVGKSIFLKGARVQVCGGIQPEVFRKAFTAKDGLYLHEGTAFRCLVTFEPPAHYEQTEEAWDQASPEPWERTLSAAMAWADNQEAHETPLNIQLDPEARTTFLNWRNRLDAQRDELPAALRGFLPKAFSYALRLAGALHCIQAFHAGANPSDTMDTAGIQVGIATAEFYLGQAVDAVRLLSGEKNSPPQEVSDRTRHLAQALESLRPDIDNGRLAVGFIQERYNAQAPVEAHIKSPHAMGAMLRYAGLTVSAAKLNANGRRSSRCLLWDQKATDFVQTKQTLEKPSLHPGALASTGLTDLADKADLISRSERLEGADSSTVSDEFRMI